MELLHESRLEIRRVTGKCYPVQGCCRVHPEPVLGPDKGSAADGSGASIYGSVHYDQGRFRMWYQAWPSDWDGRNSAQVGYAESDDGIVWTKPDLGNDNLVDLYVHTPSVYIDPLAAPEYRYRATGNARPRDQSPWPVKRNGYFTAHSGDGLHWELDSPEPAWEGADVITSVYHPARRNALVSMKRWVSAGPRPRRSIWNAEITGDGPTDIWCALVPDSADDMAAAAHGHAGADYYGMGMMPAGRGTVGFLWVFRHDLPYTAEVNGGIFGTVGITLTYQPDRYGRWLHGFGRADFVGHADIPWGARGLYSASNVVDVGDEQRLYITATKRSHGWYLDHAWQARPEYQDMICEEGLGWIGFVAWTRDRLFGYRADPAGGLELDLGYVAGPVRLKVNYRTEPGGYVKAELPEHEGYGFDDSITLDGDDIAGEIAWKAGPVIRAEPDEPLKINLKLERAEVYAYEIEGV